jgi:NADPH:quinone reductase-like Zn-dependent oxidoreductase
MVVQDNRRSQATRSQTMSTSTFRTAVVRVDAGVLQVEVAERRPLTDLAAVHDQAAAGRLSGKTVLTSA